MELKKLSLATAITACLLASSNLAAKQIELEVSSWKGAGAEVANFPLIIEKFEKANPDVAVNVLAWDGEVVYLWYRSRKRNHQGRVVNLLLITKLINEDEILSHFRYDFVVCSNCYGG